LTIELEPYEDFRFGIWISPLSKQVFRYKPIEFLKTGISCEVPAKLPGKIIMKSAWTSFDDLSD